MGWWTLETGAALWAVIAAVAVAGVVRGFSGFGTAMIVVPIAAAAYSPQIAVVIVALIDTLPMVPLIAAAWPRADWRQLPPILAGYAIALPLGLWFLIAGDPTLLRWFMSVVIFIVVAVLWSGWYYTGPRNLPVRMAVGGMSGFLGGAASIAGPPVILYWMALRTGAGVVRANLIIFLAAAELFAIAGLYVSGLFTARSVSLGIACMPVYLVALFVGARLFGMASEAGYRRVALIIVACAALLALPALDGLRS
ncbi:sulfite exporter TauE/SafE family protein [Roseitalea porphyridii]|uniref:Probable membrane transporter protein n=1 Tax=Roseitalea porphyridii TaxID=1852022 RepID=A0A4P6V2S9_9HYPH|nr:sulfite exporter TauE/SafE family protein [Roseitalea porphyridii]QBK31701.1 sulfite exporter TauE/SafE family protein [Roseitalea porphyridii]